MNIVSITDLRQDATNILNLAAQSQEPVYVVQNSQLRGVLLDPADYQTMQEALEDFIDIRETKKALAQPGETAIDEYMKKRFGNGSTAETLRRKRSK